MSYIVPRDKPTECRRCPFCDRYTYDCRLQRVQYESFEEQIQTCPLVSCDDRDNKVNLCDSCRNHYPDCDANKSVIIFGTGKGNDNVCACSKYSPWISEDNLHNWCHAIQTETAKCLVTMKVNEEEFR